MPIRRNLPTALLTAWFSLFGLWDSAGAQFMLPEIILSPGAKYADDQRAWQGIPGIERTPDGRLWATWYSGGEGEGKPNNYVLLAGSSDNGETWTKPQVVVVPPEGERDFDPCLWLDPMN